MSDKTVISAATLSGTLAGYYLSRWNEKHRIPFMLIGGFVGTMIGEILVRKRKPRRLDYVHPKEDEFIGM